MRLVTGDRCAGLVAAVGELLPGARCRRCMVHFERNILARVNPGNRDWTVDVLKAVFSMEPRDKALEKAESVAEEMEARKPKEAEFCLREGYRRDDDLPSGRLSPRASPPHPHQQHDRTPQPRDPSAHKSGRQLPRRTQRAHARLRAHPLRDLQRVVDTTLPRHVKTR